MIKSIHGKRYNTEASVMIGLIRTDCNSNDNYVEVVQTLFRKRDGNYFMHCATLPIINDYEEILQFEDIVPMEQYEAQMWAYKHLLQEEYEREFENEKGERE